MKNKVKNDGTHTDWSPKTQDRLAVKDIVDRAMPMYSNSPINYSALDCHMDLTGVHLNGCELDLQRLLKADELDFFHDVDGIRKNVDRKTYALVNGFLPRCKKGRHGL